MSEIVVVDNGDLSRYEVRVDGAVAGFLRYLRRTDHLDLVHTEIQSEHEGRGLAGRLVAGTLADVRARGGRIVATCPFVASYIDKHPQYRDLVAT